MDPQKIAELEATTAAAKLAAEEAGGTDEALNQAVSDAEAALQQAKEPSQSPVEAELQREEKKSKKTEADKAAYTLRKNADRLRELGGDPATAIGITHGEPIDEEDDDRPLTVGEWKRMQESDNEKTALQLADEITDETERKLTKQYLGHIKASTPPKEALRLARSMVNAAKNGQIIEEVVRTTKPATTGTAPGAPARQESTVQPELTAAEIPFTKAPFNMTPEAIIAKRPQSS